MRIFFIGAKGFPASTVPGGGGVERHVEEVAIRLAAHGHQVFVYVRDYTANPRRKKFKGVHIIPLPSWRSKNIATISHVFLATMHVLRQRADIIHYHGIGPATLSWIPRLFKPRSKIIVTFHSRDRMDPKWSWFARTYLAFGEWAALYFPHATIVVSHVLQVFCQKLYGRRTIYIPNGAVVHKKEGTSLLKSFDVKPNQYFLGVGRLVPNKAYDVVMEAYVKVDSTMPLVIVGDAEYANAHVEHLERLASQDSRIRLVGYQSGEPLHQLLAHCYAFIHPSRAEGLSTAVLEAMAHGKAVIMSNIKENLELIDHSGIAFRVDDRRALRKTLEWVVRDPAMMRERGERAQKIVQQKYSWDSVVRRIEEVYKSL